jgi:outer membrane protein assembly factor BamB
MSLNRFALPHAWSAFGLVAVTLLLGACASGPLAPAAPVPEKPAREVAVAVTVSNQLISFNAATPGKLLWKRPLVGLQRGEDILGIDYRQKNDTLYALGSSGRLYTVDTEDGKLTAVGAPFAVALQGSDHGFDFNPTVDRIRVAGSSGQNMRLHPDTGAEHRQRPGLRERPAQRAGAGLRQRRLRAAPEAVVSVFDSGFVLGDGVWEGPAPGERPHHQPVGAPGPAVRGRAVDRARHRPLARAGHAGDASTRWRRTA